MINTLNETHLHKTLKQIYSLQNPDSQTEKEVGSYIADIVTKEGDIIEIQTGSLGSLLKKIKYYLQEGRKITVVYPIPTCKYIETRDSTGKNSTRRKSPGGKNIFSAFRELTGLYSILLKKNFSLELLYTTITEERKKTEEAVQSKNGRRRFKKNWLKTGKKLESIDGKVVLKTKKDYISLLPQDLPENFTIEDIYQEIKKNTKTIKKDYLRIFLWVYIKLEIIKESGKKGRYKTYKII